MSHVISLAAGVTGVVAKSESALQSILNNYTLPARWAVTSQGAHFLVVAEDGAELVLPEYQAILDYATSQAFALPSAGQQSEQNALVAALIDAGIWDQLDVFYNFMTDGSADFAKINWKGPGTFQAVGTGHEPTFGANTGFTGNGTSQYLNTGFVPSIDGVMFQLNNCSIGVDTAGDGTGDSVSIGAGPSGGAFLRSVRPTSDFITINNATNNSLPLSGAGMLLGQRISANESRRFYNGIQDFITAADNSISVPTNPFLVGAMNYTTLEFFSNETLKMAFVGASLAGKELALYNAWNTYKLNA